MNDKLAQLIYDTRAKGQFGFSPWPTLPEPAKNIWRNLAQVAATEICDVMAAHAKETPDVPLVDYIKHARDLYAPRYSSITLKKTIPDTILLPKANVTVGASKVIDPLKERHIMASSENG